MDDIEREVEKLINAIGSMAEIAATLYKELIKNGVDAGGAAVMASAFIKQMVANGMRGNE